MLGVDFWTGTPDQVGDFKVQTGATYPLLLCGNRCIGATGFCGAIGCGILETLYGPYDNYIVIDTQGIVRYHAANIYAHGNRYHLNEIRACVDTLVSSVVGVEDAPRARGEGLALRVGPNPFRSSVTIELVNPAGRALEASVTVHDLAGRKVATLLAAPAAPGVTTLRWSGRDLEGRAVAPGIYQVRTEVAGTRLSRRIALVR